MSQRYSSMWMHPPELVNLTRVTSLKETDYPLFITRRFSVVPQGGLGLLSPLAHVYTEILSGLNLRGALPAFIVTVSSYETVQLSGKICFLVVIHHLRLLQSFLLLLLFHNDS